MVAAAVKIPLPIGFCTLRIVILCSGRCRPIAHLESERQTWDQKDAKRRDRNVPSESASLQRTNRHYNLVGDSKYLQTCPKQSHASGYSSHIIQTKIQLLFDAVRNRNKSFSQNMRSVVLTTLDLGLLFSPYPIQITTQLPLWTVYNRNRSFSQNTSSGPLTISEPWFSLVLSPLSASDFGCVQTAIICGSRTISELTNTFDAIVVIVEDNNMLRRTGN
jgi:hypothetical protein